MNGLTLFHLPEALNTLREVLNTGGVRGVAGANPPQRG